MRGSSIVGRGDFSVVSAGASHQGGSEEGRRVGLALQPEAGSKGDTWGAKEGSGKRPEEE